MTKLVVLARRMESFKKLSVYASSCGKGPCDDSPDTLSIFRVRPNSLQQVRRTSSEWAIVTVIWP